jgi:hypothetical protein
MTQQELQLRYDHLSDKVRKMLAAQKAYFKSNKDIQLLKVSKALESEVNEIVNPKEKQQQSLFEYLAQ